MNPFNLLINYVIANSRASFYNVTGNQEVTNTALLAGMVSDNPMISYLLIDNKAKAVSETTITTVAVLPESASNSVEPETKPEDPKATQTSQSSEIVTFEVVSNQINTVKTELTEQIENLKTLLASKEDFNTLNVKLDSFETGKSTLDGTLKKIEDLLTEISKGNKTPDTVPATKTVANSKSQSKP